MELSNKTQVRFTAEADRTYPLNGAVIGDRLPVRPDRQLLGSELRRRVIDGDPGLRDELTRAGIPLYRPLPGDDR